MHIELQSYRRNRTSPRVPARDMEHDAGPAHANVIEWHQSMGLARQACARIFRDGGSPADALAVFGLAAKADVDWGRAVEMIAEKLSSPAARRAA